MNLKRKKVSLACTVTYFKVTFTTFRNILRTIFIFSISMIMFLDSAPTKSDVVNWYLEEISGDIESQEELLEKKLIVEKVGTAIPYLQTELCAEPEPEQFLLNLSTEHVLMIKNLKFLYFNFAAVAGAGAVGSK